MGSEHTGMKAYPGWSFTLHSRDGGKVPGKGLVNSEQLLRTGLVSQIGLSFMLCMCPGAISCNLCQWCELSPCTAWPLLHPEQSDGQVESLLCLASLGWTKRPERTQRVNPKR